MNMCAKDHIYYHLLSRNDQLLVNISFLLCNYLFRPSDLEFAYSDHVSLQSGGSLKTYHIHDHKQLVTNHLSWVLINRPECHKKNRP